MLFFSNEEEEDEEDEDGRPDIRRQTRAFSPPRIVGGLGLETQRVKEEIGGISQREF